MCVKNVEEPHAFLKAASGGSAEASSVRGTRQRVEAVMLARHVLVCGRTIDFDPAPDGGSRAVAPNRPLVARMAARSPSLTLGIEEEYFLVDLETGELAAEPDPAFLNQAKELLGRQMSVELFQSELEVETGVCRTIAEAAEALRQLRRTMIELAGRFGMAPVAVSSHPFSSWRQQWTTDSERYRSMAEDYQTIARRSIVTGMHVHVGVEDDEQRIGLMNRVIPWLPLLLALSASSPFWQGRDTGLKAIRGTVFGEFPRTGIPDRFASFADWQVFIDLLGHTEVLPDPTKLWWDIRPSVRWPTVEMRITDVCTRIDDALTIAALYQSLMAKLAREDEAELDWHRFQRALVEENKWRAQRSGTSAHLADYDCRALVPVADLVDRLVDELEPDARDLGCLEKVRNARRIVSEGTSADRQLAIHHGAVADGASAGEAGHAVVRWLTETTAAGTG
jgi:carboxylate-amine ligase